MACCQLCRVYSAETRRCSHQIPNQMPSLMIWAEPLVSDAHCWEFRGDSRKTDCVMSLVGAKLSPVRSIYQGELLDSRCPSFGIRRSESRADPPLTKLDPFSACLGLRPKYCCCSRLGGSCLGHGRYVYRYRPCPIGEYPSGVVFYPRHLHNLSSSCRLPFPGRRCSSHTSPWCFRYS